MRSLRTKSVAATGALALAILSQAAQGGPITSGDDLLSKFEDAVVRNAGEIDVTRLPMVLQGYQSLESGGYQGLYDQGRPPVPEPATLSLLGLGLAALGVGRWRKRK